MQIATLMDGVMASRPPQGKDMDDRRFTVLRKRAFFRRPDRMRPLLVTAAALALAAPLLAQTSSEPQPLAQAETIPPARDVAFPGTIRLEVDATDTQRRIYRVVETIPIDRPGRLTLL